jgi:hypothetical protein
MKFVKVIIKPIKIKCDPEDVDTLQQDLYEKVQSLLDLEELKWEIDEEESEDDED